jgi:hypothetical protein
MYLTSSHRTGDPDHRSEPGRLVKIDAGGGSLTASDGTTARVFYIIKYYETAQRSHSPMRRWIRNRRIESIDFRSSEQESFLKRGRPVILTTHHGKSFAIRWGDWLGWHEVQCPVAGELRRKHGKALEEYYAAISAVTALGAQLSSGDRRVLQLRADTAWLACDEFRILLEAHQLRHGCGFMVKDGPDVAWTGVIQTGSRTRRDAAVVY